MLFSRLCSILFPRVCGICECKINKNNTCEKCSSILQYSMRQELCIQTANGYVDELISLFQYQGDIRTQILQFKFKGKVWKGYSFAEIMASVLMNLKIQADCVIPVPIHRKRYAERGYNQSEILGRNIAEKINVPFVKRCLVKVKNNVAQGTLHAKERQNNVKNVYQVVNNRSINGKVVLLIDDIYTTGATVSECAKELKSSGASKVIVMTIAYGKA